MPLEAKWRLVLSIVLLLGSLANSPNPWGYLQELSALSQALFIVGIMQLFEALFVVVRVNPARSDKPES